MQQIRMKKNCFTIRQEVNDMSGAEKVKKKLNVGDFVTKWGTIATMLIMFILFTFGNWSKDRCFHHSNGAHLLKRCGHQQHFDR